MITSRLSMILTTDELSRIQITEIENGELQITADVHGMKCIQVRQLINNIISIVRSAFQLVIIHGYNHGTAIKDMPANDFNNVHISERHTDTYNYGVTHMSIAA